MKTETVVRAKDIMNPDVLTVPDDMTVQQLANFLLEHQISGAPVVDGTTGKMIGVVSLTDIAQSTSEGSDLVTEGPNRTDFYDRGWEDLFEPTQDELDELEGLHIENEGLRVWDIMTPAVYTIPEETPNSDIARTLIAGRIHRLFVTREDRVVGIITTIDMLKLLVDRH